MAYQLPVTFLCVDDEMKIDYGKPTLALSTGVRGGNPQYLAHSATNLF